ncbi:site-2 protease family protein [candidate division WOR-3 bacterium]|uniref:Site-2 protease family protein n=1 Tax=candidate division WOR-3 bacterium TaxID=2052148 RepID=A0A9D5KAA6_UNCW3|nr:site-2 protease family protein [candidate division WOR-3 bacterium]MBD3365388.1 site-2 protease family protein [candidate division WOR-3 bacterium]
MFGCVERFLDPQYWIGMLMAVPAIVIGLTFHEYAHAWTANRLGDPTARALGRLTFNPIKHLSLIGTICFLIFRIGWAKPVPVNPENFKKPRKGMILVSVSGPTASLIIAIAFGLVARILSFIIPPDPSSALATYLYTILVFGALLNTVFAIFNILPIPPLDGSQILFNLLPPRYNNIVMWLQRYGFFILLAFIVLLGPFLWLILGTPSMLLSRLLVGDRIMSIIQYI